MQVIVLKLQRLYNEMSRFVPHLCEQTHTWNFGPITCYKALFQLPSQVKQLMDIFQFVIVTFETEVANFENDIAWEKWP